MAESADRESTGTAPSPSPPNEGSSDHTEHIDLDLPADPNVLSLVRLTVGVVAARADLGLEDVDDLRLAVEELFLSLWRSAPTKPERLQFRFTWDKRGTEVRCRFTPGKAPAGASGTSAGGGDGAASEGGSADDTALPWLPGELSAQILEALVDDYDVDAGVPAASGWVRKRRTTAAD